MNIPLIRRFGLPLVLMAVVALILAGCNDSSPTEPKLLPAATPTPTPTSTPTPSSTPLPPGGNITGTWSGKFDPADFVDCDGNTPAQASFQQNGLDIVGTLNATENGCGFTRVTLRGTLQGTTLDGTVTGDRFSNGTAKAALSGTTLEIALTSACPGELCIPGGQMHLHR